jgi:hypothetical protein
MDKDAPQPLVLDMQEPELIMWDGAGTAHFLARGNNNMSPRVSAITVALLKLAISEIEAAK